MAPAASKQQNGTGEVALDVSLTTEKGIHDFKFKATAADTLFSSIAPKQNCNNLSVHPALALCFLD